MCQEGTGGGGIHAINLPQVVCRWLRTSDGSTIVSDYSGCGRGNLRPPRVVLSFVRRLVKNAHNRPERNTTPNYLLREYFVMFSLALFGKGRRFV